MEQEPVISNLAESILDICEPRKIILFSKKYNIAGELKSFKICIIVPDDVDIAELECRLYLELDCENPYDILIYRISEWEDICTDDTSFANKILRNGAVLYEI